MSHILYLRDVSTSFDCIDFRLMGTCEPHWGCGIFQKLSSFQRFQIYPLRTGVTYKFPIHSLHFRTLQTYLLIHLFSLHIFSLWECKVILPFPTFLIPYTFNFLCRFFSLFLLPLFSSLGLSLPSSSFFCFFAFVCVLLRLQTQTF